MRNIKWNRFPIKNLLIDSLHTPIVESTYLECLYAISRWRIYPQNGIDAALALKNRPFVIVCDIGLFPTVFVSVFGAVTVWLKCEIVEARETAMQRNGYKHVRYFVSDLLYTVLQARRLQYQLTRLGQGWPRVELSTHSTELDALTTRQRGAWSGTLLMRSENECQFTWGS